MNALLVGGVADLTFYWGLTDGVVEASAWANTSIVYSADTGWVSTNVPVRAGGTYYYRSYVTNAYGSDWANTTTNLDTTQTTLTLFSDVSTLFELGGALTVTAKLEHVAASNVTVHFLLGGDAVLDTDYEISATSIVITAGDTWGVISVTGLNDSATEPIESISITVTSVVAAEIGSPSTVALSLISDDAEIINTPATSIAATSATLNGTFTYGDTGTVSIFWGTTDGTNVQGSWGNTNAFGVLSEGALSTNITGLLANQTYYYRCYVTNAAGEDWAEPTTNFTTDPPTLSITDASVTEGDSGTADLTFTITVTAVSATNIWVAYSTADGTTLAGSDYLSTSGVARIDAGQTSTQITVVVQGDASDELPFELLYLNLSNPTNVTISDSQAVGTITDDDPVMGAWNYRMKITFTNYNRSEPLTNFPALVVFTTNRLDYSTFASTNGYDLRIMNQDVSSTVNYEIESWGTNTNSYIWVQVPVYTNNCYVWAYWGNVGITEPPYYTTNGATWSEGFAGVWHLDQTNNIEDLRDSTVPRYNASENGNTTNAVGVVSDGESFDGGDYLTASCPSALEGNVSFTVSFWMNFNTTSSREWVMDFGNRTTAQGVHLLI
ncbi:MAG: Calx-beta domain-containing protein, partial [Alphaproteobacteria bacterium]